MKRKNKCASKKPYFTLEVAKRVIRRAYVERGVMLRHYECPLCLDFHVTHKNVDPAPFREIDKEIIRKQWGKFEVMFNTMWGNVYGKSKQARKRARRVARGHMIVTQEQNMNHDKLVSLRLQKQIPLSAQKQIFQELRAINNGIQGLFSQIDYSNFMWKSLKWLP